MLKGLLRDVVGEILRTTTYRRDIEGKRRFLSELSLQRVLYVQYIAEILLIYRRNIARTKFALLFQW